MNSLKNIHWVPCPFVPGTLLSARGKKSISKTHQDEDFVPKGLSFLKEEAAAEGKHTRAMWGSVQQGDQERTKQDGWWVRKTWGDTNLLISSFCVRLNRKGHLLHGDEKIRASWYWKLILISYKQNRAEPFKLSHSYFQRLAQGSQHTKCVRGWAPLFGSNLSGKQSYTAESYLAHVTYRPIAFLSKGKLPREGASNFMTSMTPFCGVCKLKQYISRHYISL